MLCQMKKLSIVLPALNEAGNLPSLVPEIISHIPKKYAWEIIIVDDGSTDGTSRVIEALGSGDKRIKGLVMYRRFGHQSALRAGITKATGDAVITMDSDFQHPPELLPKLISPWEKGHDLVQAKKAEDKSAGHIRSLERAIGYWVWNKVSNGVLSPGISDFRLMDKRVVSFVNQSDESEIFLRGLVMLVSKNPIFVPYRVGVRKYGRSSYSTRIFMNMFANGFISFSVKPLRLAWVVGVLIILSSSVFLVWDIFRAIVFHIPIIQGWLTVVTLLLLLNGFIILYLGIIGEYIGVLFKEVKNRPKYLVQKTINL